MQSRGLNAEVETDNRAPGFEDVSIPLPLTPRSPWFVGAQDMASGMIVKRNNAQKYSSKNNTLSWRLRL